MEVDALSPLSTGAIHRAGDSDEEDSEGRRVSFDPAGSRAPSPAPTPKSGVGVQKPRTSARGGRGASGRKARKAREERGGKQQFDITLLQVAVPSFRAFGEGSQFTSYEIRVTYQAQSWQVSRRYRQFSVLHQQLLAAHKLRVPKLPPKTLSPNPKSADFLQRRRAALEAYLRAVLDDPVLRQQQCVASFLALDPTAASSGYIDHDWMSRTGAARGPSRARAPGCAIL